MNNNQLNILIRNNTGNIAKSDLINGFVIRNQEFHSILNELSSLNSKKRNASCLVLGQRGAGKTTLLHRLKYAIEDDVSVLKTKIPVMLSEEQYDIIELVDLFEKIIECLDETEDYSGLYNDFYAQRRVSDNLENDVFNYITASLLKDNQQIVVFIENIDMLFKKIGKEGQLRLRGLLDNSKTVQIVGSATAMFDGVNSTQDSFYSFFKIFTLQGLTKEDTLKFLLKIGEQTNESKEISALIHRDLKRVESLRRLTGGNPRMISYLFNIFLDNANGQVIKDLYRLLDDLTFLYKAELDQLSPQQQKVIDCMARNWDAISVKELVLGTRIESKHVSSVLGNLEKNQMVEKISTKSKNNLYIIKDRFLNIWYLMRFGKKKEKDSVIWLVRFYDAWCDRQELTARVDYLFKNLAEGELDSKVALDMANTFLSCKNIPATEKYNIYTRTKEAFPKTVIERLSTEILYKTIRAHVKKKNFAEALAVLQELDKSDVAFFSFAYWIYSNMGDYREAASNLEHVFEIKQDHLTAHTLAQIFHFELKDLEKGEKYYSIAIKKGYQKAMLGLANLQYNQRHETEMAIATLQEAIDNEVPNAIMELATIHYMEGNNKNAEILCRKAMEEGDPQACLNLSILLHDDGREQEAIDTLEEAVSTGNNQALLHLAEIYIESDNIDHVKIIDILQQAIEEKVDRAEFLLGRYYFQTEKNLEKAEKYLIIAAKRKDEDAAHLLAHLYHETDDWANAEKWFVRSFELGRKSAYICMANCAISSNISKRKSFILSKFQDFITEMEAPSVPILIEYGKLLLWNGKAAEAIKIIQSIGPRISQILSSSNEKVKENILKHLTELFIEIIATKKMQLALELFENGEVNYKQIIRPVYFALMNYLKKELPNEYLRAGNDMSETVDEVISEIERRKSQIK